MKPVTASEEETDAQNQNKGLNEMRLWTWFPLSTPEHGIIEIHYEGAQTPGDEWAIISKGKGWDRETWIEKPIKILKMKNNNKKYKLVVTE